MDDASIPSEGSGWGPPESRIVAPLQHSGSGFGPPPSLDNSKPLDEGSGFGPPESHDKIEQTPTDFRSFFVQEELSIPSPEGVSTTASNTTNNVLHELVDFDCGCTLGCLAIKDGLLADRLVEAVTDARSATKAVKRSERCAHACKLLRNCARKNKKQVCYRVLGVEVCKSAFRWVHNLSEGTFNRAHAEVNNEYRAINYTPLTTKKRESTGGTAHAGLRTATARTWLTKYVLGMVHNPPNGKHKQMSAIAPHALYSRYCDWCTECAKTAPIGETTFRGMFLQVKKKFDIRVRASKQGSKQCAFCNLLEDTRAKTKRSAEVKELQLLKEEHEGFHSRERQFYTDAIVRAVECLLINACWAADGADQSAHDIPNFGARWSNALNKPWPVKIECMVSFGELVAMFFIAPMLKAGAALMLTMTVRFIQLLATNRTVSTFPRKLWGHFDGGSENWNKAVLGFYLFLFHLYPELQEVQINRMGVGKTHINIDRSGANSNHPPC